MRPELITVLLLAASNVFMTLAWYGHLRNLKDRPWFVAALVSWGIALFEYLLQVPANRIGHRVMSVSQLKILQEAITLTVFVPFAILFLRERPRLDFVWAALCMLAAVGSCFAARVAPEAIHRPGAGRVLGCRPVFTGTRPFLVAASGATLARDGASLFPAFSGLGAFA